MSAALVATCLNEASAIEPFLDAVLAQTRRPDEVTMVDGGSTDGTADRIRERIAAGAPITLIVEAGAGRSRGRNVGIEASQADTVALTDVGSRPRPEWFGRIVAPLEADASVDVVAGYYIPLAQGTWRAAVAAATVPAASEVDPGRFLPSARSVALRKAAWERAGGYPEGLQFGEDTAFGLALRKAGARFVFEPAALVEWQPESRPGALFRQFARYASGDARAGQWFGHYTKAYALAAACLVLAVAGIAFPFVLLGLPLGALAYWLRQLLRARRRTPSLAAAALAPLANAVVDLAHVVGYTAGLLGRGKRGPPAG
jgi:glycosyltransferase involved in cell wall biosynthesis